MRKLLLGLLFLSTAALGAEEDGDVHETAEAIFAGGCFWCMEPPFDELPGVVSTTSGYIGGHKENPSYREVSAGDTGHAEAVKVVYDPDRVTYRKLLEVFWHNIDPLAIDRQFCDIGAQYRSAIFYLNEEQKALALASRTEIAHRFDDPVATGIEAAGVFYPAEKYHQDYYRKNPIRYKFYRYNCGRDARLEALWGPNS
ncbi:MAG: peptide-methionine (S)-S-oxide reductase MsrA [Pseudomonadales bacterium]|nr:peptide-methionine (S)-S-oxide reductase MsrA [Pseudomonadales bacterium]